MINQNEKHIRKMILVFCVIIFTGCARFTEIPLQNIDEDKVMGRKIAREVEMKMGLYEDIKLTAYVKKVGKRVAEIHEDQRFDYTLEIVDLHEVNAFAIPGGGIYVSRGLLAATNNESELAHVIAHEVIHVSRRHSARQMARSRLPALLSLPGKVVGAVLGERLGDIVNTPLYLTSGAIISKHGRQDEFESDHFGQELAARAGYEPRALPDILGRMQTLDQIITGQTRTAGFFDSHPTTPDRTDLLYRSVLDIQWTSKPGISGSSKEYLRRLNGLLVGADPANGFFKKKTFLHPVLNFTVTFPKKWETLNSRNAVLAIEPKKEALLILQVGGRNVTAREKATSFKRNVKEAHGISPVKDTAVKVGSLPGYLLTYVDKTKREDMYIHFLWFEYGDLLYQFNAFGTERYRPVLKKAALSFRPLKKSERNSIKEMRLRVVTAQSGEKLAQLSKRTGNKWPLEYTAAINGIEVNQPLPKGKLIKIAFQQRFKRK